MPPEQSPQRPHELPNPYETTAFSTELGADTPTVDLHGMDAEEAIRALEHAMDQAIYHGEESIRVIHGRGSGKLREAVWKYLQAHSDLVGHFRDSQAPGQQGGVTIVVLRV